MSVAHNPKDYVAPYEMADPWEEVLLGDNELFREMTEPFIPDLLEAARREIKCERAKGNLSDTLQPEELVGETLIQAWIRRYSRSPRESLKEWLLANQRWALRLIVVEEKGWVESKAISLEARAKYRLADNDNDSDVWDWVTPQFIPQDCWRDVIADENSVSHVA